MILKKKKKMNQTLMEVRLVIVAAKILIQIKIMIKAKVKAKQLVCLQIIKKNQLNQIK